MTMVQAVFYQKKTGQIMNVTECLEEQVKGQSCSQDCTYLIHTGDFFPAGDRYYVEKKKVIPLPTRPSSFHNFNYSKKVWELDSALAWENVRYKRDQLLKESDWTTLSDVTMSEDYAEQWKSYRQALRDITEQNDPINIEWPSIPTK